ncbi:MAG: SRPBCC family protein [bacterium]
MKPIDLTVELPGNIETAWKWLTTEELQKKWMTGLQSLKRDDGSTAYEPGSAWTMVMQEGKKLRTYHATIPEVQYPKRFTLSIDAADLANGGKIEVEYKLTPQGDKTRLDYHSKLVAERFSVVLKIFSTLIIMMIRRNTGKLFKNLVAEMANG